MTDTPTLSVVIAAWPDARGVAACLEALAAQLDAGTEVLVAATGPPPADFSRQFPWARWLEAGPDRLIPHLWGLGIARSCGAVVAITTAQFTPALGWVAAIRDAHARLDDPVVGGPIDPPRGGGPIEWATFFLRYSPYLRYRTEQSVADVAGDNASYKREALLDCQDLGCGQSCGRVTARPAQGFTLGYPMPPLRGYTGGKGDRRSPALPSAPKGRNAIAQGETLGRGEAARGRRHSGDNPPSPFPGHTQDLAEQGFWELDFHRRLRSEGKSLVFVPAVRITQCRSFGFWAFLRQRFSHGRHFGSARFRGRSPWLRALAVAAAPLIPVVFLSKIVGRVARSGRDIGPFLVALPVLVCFLLAWSLGEALGYALPGAADRVADVEQDSPSSREVQACP